MKRIYTLTAGFAFCIAVSGQSEKLINPSDLRQQTIVTEPLSLQKGFLRVGLFFNYSALDKYFTESGKKDYLPESTWGTSSNTQLWVQYGISDRIMVEVGVPYTNDLTNFHWNAYEPESDAMLTSNLSTKGKGMGDIILSGTYQLIPSSGNKFSLKGQLDLTVPTGRKNPKNVVNAYEFDAPTGNGVFVIAPKFTARYIAYPFSFMAYTSYDINFSGKKIINPGDPTETSFRYGNFLFSGVSINILLNDWIAFTNDFNYSHTSKKKVEGVPSSEQSTRWGISYEPRLIFQIHRFRLGEAINIPLRGKQLSADPLYILMAQYVF